MPLPLSGHRAFALSFAIIAACAVPETTFTDKACDPSHLCPDALVCRGGHCRDPDDSSATVWSPESSWNKPIDAAPELAPGSAAMVAKIAALKPPTAGIQLNRDAYTPIVAYADANAELVVVSGLPGGWRMDDVPMPADAILAGDPSGLLVIVDIARNRVWNIGGAARSGASMTGYGYAVYRADGPGWWDATTSVNAGYASGASYLGGLIFPEEIRAGYIPHALAIQIDPSAVATTAVAPALYPASGSIADGVPAGSLLQLEPTYDLTRLGAEARVIAEAWKTFGAFVVDRGSGVALLFRSSHNLPNDPYAGMDLSGLDGELLRHLRVIAPRASFAYDSAETFAPPVPYQP
ncbi:MAG: hypothetical protein ACAI38_07690 [Myxococcota bacterium]